MDHPAGGQVAVGGVEAVSDAWAAAVVQLAGTTYAGANQTHPAELLSNREGDLSLRWDNTILTAGLLTEKLHQRTIEETSPSTTPDERRRDGHPPVGLHSSRT